MQNLITFIAGRKGSGKTTLALRIAQDAERVVALDTTGQYGPAHGFDVFVGRETIVKALLDTRDADAFRVSLRGSVDELLDAMRLCYELPNMLVIIEEASFYCSPYQLPDELAQLIRYGRHRQLDQLYIARRPSEIHRDVTAQADVGVSFAQHEPSDVRYLRAVAGPGAERVQALPPYRAMLWGDIGRAPLAAIEAADVILDRLATSVPVSTPSPETDLPADAPIAPSEGAA